MSIRQSLRQKIRERADFLCDYCGTSETDSGGELTVDHFQSQSKNGGDEEEISSIAVSDATFTKAIFGTMNQINPAFSIRERTNATNIFGFPNQENFSL